MAANEIGHLVTSTISSYFVLMALSLTFSRGLPIGPYPCSYDRETQGSEGSQNNPRTIHSEIAAKDWSLKNVIQGPGAVA